MTTVKPYKIAVKQAVLDDLQSRLQRTRWPDEPDGAQWQYGTNLGYMKNLTKYWLEEYDWRSHEAQLNELPNFTTKINGIDMHFVHQPSNNPAATPLLLLHGWPDSFYRFHLTLPLLKEKYHVVVPSLPGFGFSERVAVDTNTAADMCAELMQALGYEKFVAAGGDTGSAISMSLASRQPEVLLGMHLTDVGYPDHTTDFSTLTPPEQEFASLVQKWWFTEGAFNMVHSTKPQSVAFAFNDSPVGMAAWIINMMASGSTGEALEKRLSRDELLTNIMIYWVTETIGSSIRTYYVNGAASGEPLEKSDVPAAVARCPHDAPLPREWAERKVNLIRYAELERGGHFAAWEVPEVWVEDLDCFVKILP